MDGDGAPGPRCGRRDNAARDPGGIPPSSELHALYSWTHPAPSLGNTFYLNSAGFYLRYAIYVVL